MKPIDRLTQREAAGVRLVLTDIDDTLTSDGYLVPSAFQALWDLHASDIAVVPVTGRPAGWCDLIIREWPVAAVIGENGAFVYYRSRAAGGGAGAGDAVGGRIAEFTHPSVAGEEIRRRLSEVREAVLSEVPGARVARDQFSRIYDLAIDFREDPPYLPLSEAQRIKSICERFGARAKISSIHVNTWFGNYDKLSMARLFLAEHWKMNDDALHEAVLYCGDSPNDEPMFRFFPLACGVANISRYFDLLEARPAFVSAREGGEGFAEIAGTLLEKRKKSSP